MRTPPLAGPRSLAAALLLPVAVSSGCDASAQERPNVLTEEERADGWRLLFDGRTTEGWRAYRGDSVPDGWQVVDGTLARVAPAGDLVTVDEFDDFELALEWTVEPAGNSGIFYRATEEFESIWHGAPEMQVLDDARHVDGGDPLTSAGALYALYPAPEGVVKPAGEWNAVRIVADGPRIEQWLNGVKTVEAEIGSPDWEARVAASKFADLPGFARAPRGRIGLQDHDDRVAYRNIKIRELP
jgi:hypothetical protein